MPFSRELNGRTRTATFRLSPSAMLFTLLQAPRVLSGTQTLPFDVQEVHGCCRVGYGCAG
jgi:hypothetical protein